MKNLKPMFQIGLAPISLMTADDAARGERLLEIARSKPKKVKATPFRPFLAAALEMKDKGYSYGEIRKFICDESGLLFTRSVIYNNVTRIKKVLTKGEKCA